MLCGVKADLEERELYRGPLRVRPWTLAWRRPWRQASTTQLPFLQVLLVTSPISIQLTVLGHELAILDYFQLAVSPAALKALFCTQNVQRR